MLLEYYELALALYLDNCCAFAVLLVVFSFCNIHFILNATENFKMSALF